MIFTFFLRLSLVFALVPLATWALENGVARTPAMGWNPYNTFSCDTTEAQYHTAAQSLISLGLKDVGYNYLNIDCGWQGTARTSSGDITWNTKALPNGVPALGTFVHGLGLKFGLYSDSGVFSCDFVGGTAGWLGSLNHEEADATTFAAWQADYLKYDNCYSVNATDFVDFFPPIQLEPQYKRMSNALLATKRPIVFSVCNWGVQDPARWVPALGNSWRTSNDIGPPNSWENIFRIINQVVPITGFAGPGSWNDLDMLEVGNSGLTSDEQQTHFAFWAAAKSPLLISTDLTRATTQTLSILKNTRIIAVNQDSLGKSIALKRRYTNDNDVWAGPLSDGSIVVVIINWQNSSRSLPFNLADVGYTSALATNLITGATLGRLELRYTTTVPAHGSLVLKLTSPTISSIPTTTTYYLAAAPSNTLSNGAVTRTVNSSIVVVGNIGNGGMLTFNGVDGGTSGGTRLLSLDCINADYVFSNTACSNCRNAFFSVNGGTAVQVQIPISGQSWDILYSGYLVSLDGFKAGKTNTIMISNPSAWAPDFYRVGVVV